MPSLRRFAAPILVITVLILLSFSLISSFGESFQHLVVRKAGVALRRRDGSTITFSLPWKGPDDTKAKAISPVLGGFLGDVTNVASAILDSGSNIENEISSQGTALKAVAASVPTQVSVVFNGGAGDVASIMSAVNSLVNDATGIIGGVVGDATSAVGLLLGGVTTNTNVGVLPTTSSTSSSEPQEFLPQVHSSTVPLNITLAASLPATNSSAASAVASCSAIATTTIIPCCPAQATSTCTVTETWHSTHYETTQTLYSFMSIFTVTCTETISVCPPSSPYMFLPNGTTPASSAAASSNAISTAVAPSDCSMTASASNTNGNAIPPVASLLSSAGSKVDLSSSASFSMSSFTASLPNLPSTTSSAPSAASSLLAFRTTPVPAISQPGSVITSEAGNENTMLSSMVANVVSVLSNVGLSGDLLSTVMSDVASALSAANTLAAAVPVAGNVVAGVSGVLR